MSRMLSVLPILAGLTSTAIRTALGSNSCSSARRFGPNSVAKKLMPVRFPPGHARTHEINHQRRKAIELAFEPMVLHRYVLALEVTAFVEALAECGSKGRIG